METLAAGVVDALDAERIFRSNEEFRVSTKEYGCFFCSEKSVDARGKCPGCGAPIDVATELLSRAIGEYQPKGVLGRGFYGWTLQVEDGLQTFALKVVPEHRLAGRIPDAE